MNNSLKEYSESNFDIKNIPYSLEAEQSVLGAIIISPDRYEDIAGNLTESDFYLEIHRQIFEAITELYLKSKALDLITLLDMVTKNTNFDETRGKEYITHLANYVPSTSNIKDYAAIVRDKSVRRKLIKAASDITAMAYEDTSDIDILIDRAQQLIFSLARTTSANDLLHIKYVLVEAFEQLQKVLSEKDKARGLASGFSSVDNILVGMNPGDLILVGARPGMGKTSFAMNIAVNVAAKKKVIAVFSLEMSKLQITSRALACEARIDSYKMRSGRFTNEEWVKIAEAAARLSECDIFIDDTPGITVTAMKAKLRKLKKLDLVIIDYLGLMQNDRRNDNRVQEVSDISRNLKILAKELGVPVITCAQLSRGPEQRENKRPLLSDLRDSGAIEQDADVVMFLYREEYYKESVDAHKRAEVIFAKNRHGSVGKVDVGWEGAYTRFYDIDTVHTE